MWSPKSQLKAKNVLKALVGYSWRYGLRGQPYEKDKRVYINIRHLSPTGGPDRFLRNLLEVFREHNISTRNLSPVGCNAALVFSASWGNSFVKLCRHHEVYSVLRVDGFYTPRLLVGLGKHELREKHYLNTRMSEDISDFDFVIYQTKFSKQMADQYLFERNSDFAIVNNGVNIQHFSPIKDRISHTKPLEVVVLGNHYDVQLELALKVFRLVRKDLDIQLRIIGAMRDRRSPVNAFLDRHCKNPDERNHLICQGIVEFEDLPTILAQGDILLHVKIEDWCPNAVLEAMSCGMPIVCPAKGGTSELIGDGGIAIAGDSQDDSDTLAKGMADAIAKILRDPEPYRQRARNRAVSHFDIQKVAKSYLEILRLNTY